MSEALHILVGANDIRKRVAELAREIDACYPASLTARDDRDRLVMICVLKGAFMFFSDLVRQMRCRPMLDFIGMSSYGLKTVPSEQIDLTKDVTMDLEGRDVLLVEDIVDTGQSMRFLIERLRARHPRSLRLAALIDKRGRRTTDVHVDFAGFGLEGFIVGYGLDYAERYRELPALYTLDLE